jgi:hypothetical protein
MRCRSIVGDLIIPEGFVTVCPSAFKDCKQLRSVQLPVSVTAVERYAFWGCTSLERVDSPHLSKWWPVFNLNHAAIFLAPQLHTV